MFGVLKGILVSFIPPGFLSTAVCVGRGVIVVEWGPGKARE